MGEVEDLQAVIRALEKLRPELGDQIVDAGVFPLRDKLSKLERAANEQRRMVTILFADVSGFTAMAEKRDPERVREAVNALWARLDAVILGHGGTIDKHIGDAVMALFGAPRAREDDPARAVRAALEMQSAMRDEERLSIRIGIHTGPVIVGIVGSTSEYTALGDAVNVASRLESAAPVGGVLISRETYRQVEGIFEVTERAGLSLKGKSEKLTAYEVKGVRADRKQRWRGVQGVQTRMVGRDREAEQLQNTFDEVATSSTPRLTLISGEAGMGKSRMIWSFQDWLSDQKRPARVFKSRVTEETQYVPYALFRDLFLFLFKIQESDPAELARRKLLAGFENYPGVREEDAHFIGHLIGLEMSDSPYLAGILSDAAQLRDRAFEAVSRFVEAASRERRDKSKQGRVPVVFRFEDLHWADQGSLDLVRHVEDTSPELPVLFVCTARPQVFVERSDWLRDSDVRIPLEPLTAGATRDLVDEILQSADAVPATLRERLTVASAGNPFFLEEIVNSLIEEGIVVPGDPWKISEDDLEDLKVPSSLTALLQTRVDRLDEAERAVLQQASILGRRFWDDALSNMNDELAIEELTDTLQDLCNRELLLPVETSTFQGAHEYAFRHALLRDAIYETVLLRERPSLHAKAAQWLTRRSGEGTDAWSARIAFHWEHAGERVTAGRWYTESARHAYDMFANAEAAQHARRALELLPELDERALRIDAFYYLGQALPLLSQLEEAEATLRSMVEESELAGDAQAQARAWTRLAAVLLSRRKTEEALEALKLGERLADEVGDREELGSALVTRGYCHYMMGDAAAAVQAARQAFQRTLPDDLAGKARAQRLLCNAYRLQGKYIESVQAGEEALAKYRNLGDQVNISRLLNELGEAARLSGDYRQASALYQEALIRQRSEAGRLTTMVNLGAVKVELGEPEAALKHLDEVVEKSPEGWVNLAEARVHRAQALLALGRCEEALGDAEEAVKVAPPQLEGLAWRVLGAAMAQCLGDLEGKPTECFEASAKLFEDSEMTAERARTLRAWAEAELQFGDSGAGQARWAEALTLFEQIGLPLEVERMRRAKLPN